MSTAAYHVTGMTCGHCELSVREELEQLPGIANIEVSAASGTLIVTSADTLDDALVLAAVEEAGYAAVRA